ncbi:hypothetical protein Hanom_Chr06g00508101 [Helianthus anomalus]
MKISSGVQQDVEHKASRVNVESRSVQKKSTGPIGDDDRQHERSDMALYLAVVFSSSFFNR